MSNKKTEPSEYRREIERLAAAAFAASRKKRDEARALEQKARKLRAVSAGIDDKAPGPMGTAAFRRTKSRVVLKSRFRSALAKRGLTVPDWARAQTDPPLAVETAKSWLRVKTPRPRPCPEFWAKKIEREFMTDGVSEVPAVDSSWPHGVKRG